MDFVGKFITAMVNGGIIPKSTFDIVPSDRFRRIACEADRHGKKSISYWLKIETDFSYGYAKDFKSGAEISFNSATNDQNMTRADVSRIKAILRARQAEQDIRIAERHEKIAHRAKYKWSISKQGGSTPYLEKKGFKALHGARIYGDGNLFIPLYEMQKDGGHDLVSWQIIRRDGKKDFPFGGKKHGCYHILGQINPTEPIIVCEGWATGVSIKEATNMAVVVAMDAGNLLPVSKAFRAYYKATPIIIAADNDESGTGQKYANKCQKSVTNISVVMPPMAGHDFNDLKPDDIKKAFGIEAEGGGNQSLDSDSQSQAPANVPTIPEWESNLILDGKGRLVSSSLQNAILYMLYHRDFLGCFAYDEFKQDVVLLKCPPWEDDTRFKVENISDIHITQAAATLERYGLSCAIDKTAKAIDVVAHENKFHSAKEYFSKLEWDGKERLKTLAQDLFDCCEESEGYLSFVFKKWFTAAVKRVMEPGCKFDHVLILESQRQGTYKSDFLKTIATFNGERYHTDSISLNDISNKDTILKMQGNLIIELAELSGFSKKDDNAIKNWITQTRDEVRIPFARKTVVYPRQFVFAATTNNYEYLKDPTGNRRYWPVTVERAIDIETLEDIKGQLWAEAVSHYKSGLYIGPTVDENNLAEKERQKRLQSDAWEDVVLSKIKELNMSEFRTSDVIDRMGFKIKEKDENTVRRVNGILKQNGYKNEPIWDHNLKKSVRVWTKE